MAFNRKCCIQPKRCGLGHVCTIFTAQIIQLLQDMVPPKCVLTHDFLSAWHMASNIFDCRRQGSATLLTHEYSMTLFRMACGSYKQASAMCGSNVRAKPSLRLGMQVFDQGIRR